MIAKDYPQLFETCYTQTLPNGLTIRAIHKPEFKRIYAFLAVNYGSCSICPRGTPCRCSLPWAATPTPLPPTP